MRTKIGALVAAALMLTMPLAQANIINSWAENSVGLFAYLGIQPTTTTLADPNGLVLVSGATNASVFGNANYAFASFDPSLNVSYNLTFTNPGQYIMYAFDQSGTLVDSLLTDTTQSFTLIQPPQGSLASINDFFGATDGGQLPHVPAPPTLFLVVTGLLMLWPIWKRRKDGAPKSLCAIPA